MTSASVLNVRYASNFVYWLTAIYTEINVINVIFIGSVIAVIPVVQTEDEEARQQLGIIQMKKGV